MFPLFCKEGLGELEIKKPTLLIDCSCLKSECPIITPDCERLINIKQNPVK